MRLEETLDRADRIRADGLEESMRLAHRDDEMMLMLYEAEALGVAPGEEVGEGQFGIQGRVALEEGIEEGLVREFDWLAGEVFHRAG